MTTYRFRWAFAINGEYQGGGITDEIGANAIEAERLAYDHLLLALRAEYPDDYIEVNVQYPGELVGELPRAEVVKALQTLSESELARLLTEVKGDAS